MKTPTFKNIEVSAPATANSALSPRDDATEPSHDSAPSAPDANSPRSFTMQNQTNPQQSALSIDGFDAAVSGAGNVPPPNQAPSAAVAAAPDPFDPAQFAANSTVLGGVGVTKELVTCPVRKPNKQEFVRVLANPDYQLRAHILELKEEKETYLVMPAIAAELPGETRLVTLRLAVSRQGAVFLWPVAEVNIEGRETGWGTSARAAAAKAVDCWVRIVANMSQGAYDVFAAPGALGTPVWPEKTMRDILAIAFGDSFIIRDAGHPVIKRLMGLA
jgi:hypothetical protein